MTLSEQVQIFTLVTARLSPFLVGGIISPLRNVPLTIRILLLVIFSFVIFSINIEQFIFPSNYVIALLKELFLGSLMVASIIIAYGAILTIGKVVDMQIGLGAAGVVNPSTESQEPVLGSIYLLAFTTLFFILNFHGHFISIVNMTFRYIPIGEYSLNIDYRTVTSLFFSFFGLAFLLFAPIMLVIWCVDILIGFLSKTMPQMNIYFVTLPLKIFIGLLVASLTIDASERVFMMFFEQIMLFLSKFVGR